MKNIILYIAVLVSIILGDALKFSENHVLPEENILYCTTDIDTVEGVFLYEMTSNFASLYHDVDFERFPAIIFYDSLTNPSYELYKKGIFGLCVDGSCTPFNKDIGKMSTKTQLDTLNTQTISITNGNFNEREDMLGNIVRGDEIFVYKVFRGKIVYEPHGERTIFVSNFRKKLKTDPEYIELKVPAFQIDTILSVQKID